MAQIGDDADAPFLLMRAFRTLVDAVHARLTADGFPGIRAQHGFALQAIGDGCTGVELADRLGVSKQAAAKTADRLEELGLISREADRRDRRKRTIRVSDRGAEVLHRSGIAFRAEVARWRDSLGDQAVSTTLSTLSRVGENGRSDTDLSDWS